MNEPRYRNKLMMKGRPRPPLILVLLAFSAIASNPLFAEQIVIELDPAATHVNFTLADTLHTIHGSFRLRLGIIRFDPITGDASGELVVDAKSGDSGSKGRDRRMHKDVLESQKYPEITFVPGHVGGKVDLQGESEVAISGVFTLHGTPHDFSVTTRVKATSLGLSISSHFAIPYEKWGLKNPSTFILRVSDQVDVELRGFGRFAPTSAQ